MSLMQDSAALPVGMKLTETRALCAGIVRVDLFIKQSPAVTQQNMLSLCMSFKINIVPQS